MNTMNTLRALIATTVLLSAPMAMAADNPSFIVDDKHKMEDWDNVEAVVFFELYRNDPEHSAPLLVTSGEVVVPVHHYVVDDQNASPIDPVRVNITQEVPYVQRKNRAPDGTFENVMSTMTLGFSGSVLFFDNKDGIMGKLEAKNVDMTKMRDFDTGLYEVELPELEVVEFSSALQPGSNTVWVGRRKLVAEVTLRPAPKKAPVEAVVQEKPSTDKDAAKPDTAAAAADQKPASAPSADNPKPASTGPASRDGVAKEKATVIALPEEKPAPTESLPEDKPASVKPASKK